MKTVGIIGGMSPASTVTYYNEINSLINQAKGGNHSAPLILHSVDFEEIVQCQQQNDWQKAGEILADCARKLEQAGAKALLIATNTMHKVAPAVARSVNIPLLHIVDATAQAIKAKGLNKVALLGTQFVMQQDFYREGLAKQGIDVITPNEEQQAEIHRIIFDELCLGDIFTRSKAYYLDVIDQLAEQGAQGAILGCTEIGLLIQQKDFYLPFFDTAQLHSQMAADFILTE